MEGRAESDWKEVRTKAGRTGARKTEAWTKRRRGERKDRRVAENRQLEGVRGWLGERRAEKMEGRMGRKGRQGEERKG